MRRFSNLVIAALTLAALLSGAWLVRSGGETHAPPQPSPAQARTETHRPESAVPESPALPPSPPSVSASPPSAWTPR